jgi:signal transduction histidine kinase
VLLIYFVPISAQVLLRGLSIRTVVLSYLFTIGTILCALLASGAEPQLYSAFSGLVYVAVCVELERWMRVAYVRNKLILSARESKRRLTVEKRRLALEVAEVRHSTQVMNMSNQAHLAAKEQALMRQIMGNVAHDMKTPLFSIRAELDSLKDIIHLVSKQVFDTDAVNDPRIAMAYMQAETDEKIDTILSLIYFIVMGINRSQDYAKLTTNKELKPALETVPIFEVLRMVTRCMSHQRPYADSASDGKCVESRLFDWLVREVS